MYKNSHEKSYGVPFSIKILRSYAILMLIVEIVTKNKVQAQNPWTTIRYT